MFDSIEWQPMQRVKYIVNGELCDTLALPNAVNNRAFQYGDGFFETIRVCNGVPQYCDLHWDRVEKSLEAHKIEKPDGWDIQAWQSALKSQTFIEEYGDLTPTAPCRFRGRSIQP